MGGLFAGTPLERPVTCERCEKPLAACTCPRDATGAIKLPKNQPLKVRKENRRGKTVTVVSGFDASATNLPELLGKLKSSLGAGGTVADGELEMGELEIQGDHRPRLVALLVSLGYPAKSVGG
jgi:translation initiation factor 1